MTMPFLNLLIVEDEPDYRDTLALVFKTASYTPITVGMGQDALDILQTRSDIHGIILDYTLPDMNGGEVLKKIRSISKDVFVFIHTAYTERALPELSEAIKIYGPALMVEKVTVSGKEFRLLVDSVLRP